MSKRSMNWPARLTPALVVLVAMLAVLPSKCEAKIRFTGVNLAGAEFGVVGGALPGTYNQHYTYPTTAEINYYVGKGMNVFRVPFRWERLQQSLNSALNTTELGRLNAFVNAATNAGAYVMIEPHNFARYYPNISDFNQMQSGSTGRIGGASVPISAFADLWSRLASQYKNNNQVMFNLMNEPNAISTQTWVDSSNAAIDAIRNAGAKNLILVPGISWTGAHSWVSSGNATAMLNIVDAGNNYVFDMHQYLDSDRSGGPTTIANDDEGRGVSEIKAATEWLKTNGRRGFLGEFAVANTSIGDGTYVASDNQSHPQIGDEAIHNMLDYMETHDDAWLGWAWWGGGPWWGNYQFALDPVNLSNPTDRPAMTVLDDHLAIFQKGDFNFDGIVDAGDYTVWRNAMGQTGAGRDADSNIDGVVDELDYTVWKTNFGQSLAGAGGAAALAVPEPAAGSLLAIGTLAVGLSFRRRSTWRRRR